MQRRRGLLSRSAKTLPMLLLMIVAVVACDIEAPPPGEPGALPGTPAPEQAPGEAEPTPLPDAQEPAPRTEPEPTPLPGVEPPDPNGTPMPDEPTDVEQEADPAGPLTFLAIAAVHQEFDRATLRAPARAEVRLEFSILDGEQHNWTLYESEQMENEIFSTETFSGPGEIRTYNFEAPSEPGEYFFVCEVHPEQMRGVFVVE